MMHVHMRPHSGALRKQQDAGGLQQSEPGEGANLHGIRQRGMSEGAAP